MTPAIRVVKRAMDVVGATVGLALTLPMYPFIAVAIYLESPGPILFRQRRAGEFLGHEEGSVTRLRFAEFEILKFRTMTPNAEAKTGPVLATAQDSRITRVGRILRKSRLDEVPQFWNVLRGDMSLVGPRPERPELIGDLAMAIPYFEERMRGLKPGITGLAQVSLGYTGRPPPDGELAGLEADLMNPFKMEGVEGALADDMRVKLLYDLAYSAALEHFPSFLRTELSVLLRTPLVMVKAIGQ